MSEQEAARGADLGTIDAAHLARQRAWSEQTFGPGTRLLGVLDHIRKELKEIEDNPTDVEEWVDVIILAFDGAWRAGWEPQQIIDAIKAKQAKNESRAWPDWRKYDQDEAIEHVSCGFHAWGPDDRCVTCGDHKGADRG
ncbi:MAG: dATP/dGTP pyrophosphohydrolase domain-containing protein [Mycobacteriaceae bacterium]